MTDTERIHLEERIHELEMERDAWRQRALAVERLMAAESKPEPSVPIPPTKRDADWP